MNELRFLIVAADPLARAGLASLLAEEAGCTVAAQIPAVDDWPDSAADYQVDVILWDLGWEPVQPLTDLGALTSPVIALLPEPELAPAAWATGVLGLLMRSATAEMIVTAAQAVVQQLAVLDLTLRTDLLAGSSIDEEMPIETLTAREIDVLQLLAEGLTNKAIAQRLQISEHTVKFHVNAILSKLSAQSRTEAVVRATRLGLIIL